MKAVSQATREYKTAMAIQNALDVNTESSSQEIADAVFTVLVIASRFVKSAQRRETAGINHLQNADATFKRLLGIKNE